MWRVARAAVAAVEVQVEAAAEAAKGTAAEEEGHPRRWRAAACAFLPLLCAHAAAAHAAAAHTAVRDVQGE